MTDPVLATEAIPTSEGHTEPTPADSSSTEVIEQPKTVETPEAPAGAPEAYEFSNPEGSPEGEDNSDLHAAFSEASRELNLPQEQAQGLFNKTMGAFHKHALDVVEAQAAEHVKALKADTEIGGSKLDENLGIAMKAAEAFGSKGLLELLKSPHGDGKITGNHPEVVRFLVKVGEAISEHGFVGKDPGTGIDRTDEVARAARFFPNS